MVQLRSAFAFNVGGAVLEKAYFESQAVLTSDGIQDSSTGKKIIVGFKIFKVGTFKDSKGRQHTINTEYLDQAVQNFNHLRSSGILVDVPVREDHTETVKDIVGYFLALRREGDYLVCDFEFTESAGFQKWSNGTYRARSIEINEYETNGENPVKYFPVVMGFAFVDIGAVEGLFRRADPTPAPGPPAPPKKENEMAFKWRIRGVETEDEGVIAQHVRDLEQLQADKDAGKLVAPGRPASFKINGVEVTDPAVVQKELDTLVEMNRQVVATTRHDFVDQLAAHNLILQPAVAGFKEMVGQMSETQYALFTKGYEGATPNPLLGQFGQTNGNGNGGGQPIGQGGLTGEEVETHREVVGRFRTMGWTDEKIAKTDSYKKLAAAGIKV